MMRAIAEAVGWTADSEALPRTVRVVACCTVEEAEAQQIAEKPPAAVLDIRG